MNYSIVTLFLFLSSINFVYAGTWSTSADAPEYPPPSGYMCSVDYPTTQTTPGGACTDGTPPYYWGPLSFPAICAGEASQRWETLNRQTCIPGGNSPPMANAGIDRNITQPATSISIPAGGASASDADGSVASTVWSFVSGPGPTPTITNSTTLTPTFNDMTTAGVYTFRLRVTDNGGLFTDDAMTVTVSAASTYTLTVNSSGASAVVITNSIGYGGTTNYARTGIASGTSITLTAPATSGGSTFYNWTGCDSTTGVGGVSCIMSITANRTVTANYGPGYNLTVGSSGASSVVITNASTYGGTTLYTVNGIAPSTNITLTAPAISGGNNFASWTGCDSTSGTNCTVSMTTNKIVTANYTSGTDTYSWVYVGGSSGQGFGECSSVQTSCSFGGIPYETADCTHIDEITGVTNTSDECNPTTLGTSVLERGGTSCAVPELIGLAWWDAYTCTLVPASNFALTVLSSGASAVVITNASTYGGTTNYSKSPIPTGTNITLTAPAISGGNNFASWTGCDSISGNNCTVSMTANKTVTANYTPVTYTLTVAVSPGGGGNIFGPGIDCPTVNCSATYPVGTLVPLTASPSTGYSFVNFTGACSTTATACNVSMDSNKNTTANFVLIPPFDYSLGPNTQISTTQGVPVQKVIDKTLVSGTTQSVALGVISSLPSGVSVSGISNQNCNPTCSSTITFAVSPSATVGTHAITVEGTPLNKQLQFNLRVDPSPAVSVSCDGNPDPAPLGEAVTWTAIASGGTPPYVSYTWEGTDIPTSPAPTGSTYIKSYNTIGLKNANVTVEDSVGVTGECTPSPAEVRINFNPSFEEF